MYKKSVISCFEKDSSNCSTVRPQKGQKLCCTYYVSTFKAKTGVTQDQKEERTVVISCFDKESLNRSTVRPQKYRKAPKGTVSLLYYVSTKRAKTVVP